jgi:hypothetical protein
LAKWFLVSFAIGWVIAPLVAVSVMLLLRFSKSQQKRVGGREFRGLQRTFAFCGGLIGTTIVSAWMQDFIFTWPLSLAVAFEMVVLQAAQRGEIDSKRRWRGRATLLLFLSLCLVYFLVCRRLNLASEWSFLIGFPAAVPFVQLMKRYTSRSDLWATLTALALSGLAFAAFYGAGWAILAWRYSTLDT